MRKKKNPIVYNFQTDIHVACGNDELRPVMQCVYFDNGFVVATDAHILIAQCLKHVHKFKDEDIEILNGKFLNKKIFELIRKHNEIEILCDGIKVRVKNGIGDYEMFFKYTQPGRPYMNWRAVLAKEYKAIERIGMDPDLLQRIKKGIFTKDDDVKAIVMQFVAENKMIKVYKTSELKEDVEKNFALLMPVMLTN